MSDLDIQHARERFLQERKTEPAAKQRTPVPLDQRFLVDPDVAADLLSISRDTLERSDVPFVPFGRLRRYDPEQLRQYIRARRSHEVGA